MGRLPIDSAVPEIVEHLRTSRSLIVEAPPGSGKTTRVPPALLRAFPGEVWVLEPRRLAARLAARRVAFECGERAGQTIGYQVRFEEVASPQTRLRFMTEGVFTRRTLSNPSLAGVSTVVLDEFHERHLEGDLALALLDRLQNSARPDLRLVVMSATLHADPLVAYLGGCPVVRAAGRLFDLDIEYTPYSAVPLEEQVAAAARALSGGGPAADTLVFLPGAAEIRRAARACAPIASSAGLLVVPLHGDLPADEQDRAVLPAERPKLILSTNVAESSITIEGVRAVVDSGLARVASDSPWTGLPRLQVVRVSKASARQRAGRAGRTGPGRVVRLYSEDDFARRPDFDAPEIARRELSQMLLDVAAMGAGELRWLDAPPAASAQAARELLRRLGALDRQAAITPLGRDMAALPLHPRLARLVVEAARRGVAEQGCAAAAVLSSGERLDTEAGRAHGPSDVLVLVERQWTAQTRRVYDQIRAALAARPPDRHSDLSRKRELPRTEQKRPSLRPGPPATEALLKAILSAFPDRVGKRRPARRPTDPRQATEAEVLLGAGGTAALAPSSVVRTEFLVAVDAEERPERGLPLIRLASAVEPEWLLDLFPDRVEETREVAWNKTAERVEQVSALVYDGLVIEESRSGAVDPEAAERVLAEKAFEAGVERFAERDELQEFLGRTAFAAQAGLTPIGEPQIRAALVELARGLRSFAELKAAAGDGGLLRALAARVGGAAQLERAAPGRIRLPNGRQLRVHYEPGQPPWVESRLQDFFGMRETPRLAGGRVALTVRLLAPSRRPVQITSDLAGFWERHYPQVRRELMRRYPKHKWPENPLQAEQD